MGAKRFGRIAWRFTKGVLIVAIVLAGAGALVGSAYQAIGERADAEAYPPPGDLVSIGSHRMHMHCVGEGSPTILLDAGAGGWSMHWWAYQEPLSDTNRVCTFDRSGLGWSEEGPGAYDGGAISREVHELLGATMDGPVVYVGHSMGANLAQIHYSLFPEDIAGLVLIDPARPIDLLEDFEGTREEALAIETCGWMCGAATAATKVGLVRFMTRNAGKRTLGAERQRQYHAGMSQAATTRTVLAYLHFLPKTAYQNIDATTFDDTPLTIVYSGNTRKPEGEETEEDVVEWHRETMRDMAGLASRSTMGHGPVVIEGATHQSITIDHAYVEKVLAEIARVVELARRRP
jgi:pimeloyl-ACP methyl ester carboxylesterase